MNQEQRLQIVKSLLPILHEYRSSGTARISGDQSQMLDTIYREIFNIVPVITCVSCVIQYLHMLHAWYDSQQLPVEPEPVIEIKIEIPILKKKSGRPKKQ